jgi:hypothetical protein
MLDQRRWKFGKIEVVTSNFRLLADQLDQMERIEYAHQFTALLEQWLGDAIHRRTVLTMDRELGINRNAPLLGRVPGREHDKSIVASLQSAFRANRLHVLRIVGRLSSAPLASAGRSWKFHDCQIVQRDYALQMGELAEFIRIDSSRSFSNEIKLLLNDSETRKRLLEIYETVDQSSSSSNLQAFDDPSDEDIEKDLLHAFLKQTLFLLRRRTYGDGGDETEEAAPLVAAGPAGRVSDTKVTWVEVVMVDENEKPMSGIRYKLSITDGTMREGTLDSNGSVRINGIDPGTCELTFPDVDAREWHRV